MASLCILLRSNCTWHLQSVIWKSSFRRPLAVQHFPGCMKMHELCFSDFYILLTITNCVESCRVAIDCFKFVFQGGTVLLHLTHYWHRIVPFRLRGDSPTCHYAYNYKGMLIRLREVPYTAHCLISPVLELERPANTLRTSHGHS